MIIWRMFYTAISNAGHDIFDQRIGSVALMIFIIGSG